MAGVESKGGKCGGECFWACACSIVAMIRPDAGTLMPLSTLDPTGILCIFQHSTGVVALTRHQARWSSERCRTPTPVRWCC